MRRFTIVVFCISIALVSYAQVRRHAVDGNAGITQTVPQFPGSLLAGLTPAQTSSFNAGRVQFLRAWNNIDGLGPVFNERACTDCHNAPAAGGGSARNVTRFATRVGGVFDPLTSLGGSLLQDHAITGGPGAQHTFLPEHVPAQATIVVQRRSTPLFGLGLVDATPDSVFVTLAALQAARGDGVAGRVNMTDNLRAGTKTVGRFGWKAQVPTLVQFSGDALLNEVGITSPDFPSENCPQGNCAELVFSPVSAMNDDGSAVAMITNYMMLLAAPNRGPSTPDSIAGEQIFESIGCSECHVSTLTTGSNAIASLDRKTYHPYSDFLLHDMGTLGDGLEMASSTGAEMRTEPLWGLRFVTRYLHDGRATTLEDAITAHDGQAAAAKSRYTALAASERAQLIAFLRSL
ncbi:MAG: hypothetical protein JO093_06010 [Acidobacteria bacterium]|nr:hypothetical protein [Acidobacteriota bacterium]MBV9067800.1 hypothetical protein [Acidobacteriota bacterium]MBV9185153.1 hypothetical protein [Acidobacteriota bacterium]